jgi:hypothetical protein
VAEEAEKSAKDIVKAYKDALNEGMPIGIRLQAAKDWLSVEREETKLKMAETREIVDMDHRELVLRVAQGFAKFMGNSSIAAEMREVIDSSAVDISGELDASIGEE